MSYYLLTENDTIKFSYLLENIDTKEEIFVENKIIKIIDLHLSFKSQIIGQIIGSWICFDLKKNVSKSTETFPITRFKKLEIGTFINITLSDTQDSIIGKLIDKNKSHATFNIIHPIDDSNWKVSIEVLELITN